MKCQQLNFLTLPTSALSFVGSGVTEPAISAATIWTSSTPAASCLSPGCNSLPESPVQEQTVDSILDLYYRSIELYYLQAMPTNRFDR